MCDCTTQTGGWGGSRTMPKLLAFDIRIICCKQNNTACIIKQLHVPFLSPSTSAVLTTPPWISWNFRLLITMTAISSASPSTATSYKTSKSFLYSKPKTCTCILIQFTHCGRRNICVKELRYNRQEQTIRTCCNIIVGAYIHEKWKKWWHFAFLNVFAVNILPLIFYKKKK